MVTALKEEMKHWFRGASGEVTRLTAAIHRRIECQEPTFGDPAAKFQERLDLRHVYCAALTIEKQTTPTLSFCDAFHVFNCALCSADKFLIGDIEVVIEKRQPCND